MTMGANDFFFDETPLSPLRSNNTDYSALFKGCILDQERDYPDPIPLISLVRDGERYSLLTKGSISLWQGKQKSKKTTALAVAIAAFISQVLSQDRVRFEAEERGAVIFFDCEQGQSYAARTMKLILKLAGLQSSSNLTYCDLRTLTPKERLGVIKQGIIKTPNIKIVVLDGVVDLMEDFMDPREGHALVMELLSLASTHDIHIAGVLHQNKGTSKEARAHVGSIFSQKCERELIVERDPQDHSISKIISKESRGLPFDGFSIKWNKGELPKIVQELTSDKANKVKREKALSPGDLELEIHEAILQEALGANSLRLGLFETNLKKHWDAHYGFSVPASVVSDYRRWYVDNDLVTLTGSTPHTKYSLTCYQ